MVATSEVLARIPRRKDGKRDWPNDLKARVVAETTNQHHALIQSRNARPWQCWDAYHI